MWTEYDNLFLEYGADDLRASPDEPVSTTRTCRSRRHHRKVARMFFGRGMRLGKILGVNITIDFSWFLIFALFILLLGSQLPRVPGIEGYPSLFYWGVALFTTLLFFGSVLAHELSHAVVARRNGIPVNNITLFIFGGVAQLEDEPDTPWKEFKMAIAGPVMSVCLGILFIGLMFVSGALGTPLFTVAFGYLGFINILLAVFNMLPGFPLDGGRVFRAVLWHFMGSLRRATQVASAVGQVFGWIFIVIGVGSLFSRPLAAYASPWLALIGWFLVSAARNSYQQLIIKESLSSVPVTDVMNTRVEAISPDISVASVITDYFLRESASTLPVEDHEGNLLGMIGVEDVRKVPREQWERTLIRDIMPPLANEEVVTPDDDAWDAVNRMSQTNRDRMVVTDHGHVEGVVTRGSIVRWLQTHEPRFAGGQA